MGRRGVGVDDDDRWVFNRLAEDYRARPGYPAALVDRLAALAGEGGSVVDLGAGTGLLALPLAARGIAVHAVEPASAMLDVLREGARALPIDPVHATAEETGLPAGGASLVLVSDALHWIEPEAAGHEAARLLTAGGRWRWSRCASAAPPSPTDSPSSSPGRTRRRARVPGDGSTSSSPQPG